jgi:hypothetical protein
MSFPEMPPEVRHTSPLPFWNWWQAARRFFSMLIEGGGNGEVLAKQSNADFDVAWVLPGSVGSGLGDMLKSVYDPTGVNDDAFDRANHTGTQLANTISNFSTAAMAVGDPRYLKLDQTTPQSVINGEPIFVAGVVVPSITSDESAPADLLITCGTEKTLELQNVVWDDLRIQAGSFSRPGGSDPAIVMYYPASGGLGTGLFEFAINDWVSFVCQLPHKYKTGTDVKVHLHWTPGPNGVAENGHTVGWKVDYSWANVDGSFTAMATANLSDTCDGVDDKNLMTPEVTVDGHTASKHISSMLICNLRRSDTGTDDTWVGTVAGALPMILEVDFHFQIDTIGSRQSGVK